ncbi:MAG: ABC transporter ATP-binding protein, partial [Longicatena sp.]|nr:ABC transporter ATP-binding protein [Longicatena sp.]
MQLFKEFLKYYKPYKVLFILDMLAAITISVIDLAFPQILNYLNDTFYLQTKEAIYQSLGILAIGLLIMY